MLRFINSLLLFAAVMSLHTVANAQIDPLKNNEVVIFCTPLNNAYCNFLSDELTPWWPNNRDSPTYKLSLDVTINADGSKNHVYGVVEPVSGSLILRRQIGENVRNIGARQSLLSPKNEPWPEVVDKLKAKLRPQYKPDPKKIKTAQRPTA